MRHAQAGDKLGVLPDHRRSLLRNLTLSLIEYEQIRTTPRRAKAIRWFADHVVTLGKKGDVASIRRIVQLLGSTKTGEAGNNRIRVAVEKICGELAPRFKDRNGGFTQIFRLVERRPGDNAEMCIFRFIPEEEDKAKSRKKDPDSKKSAAKIKSPTSEKPAKSAKAPSDKKEIKAAAQGTKIDKAGKKAETSKKDK